MKFGLAEKNQMNAPEISKQVASRVVNCNGGHENSFITVFKVTEFNWFGAYEVAYLSREPRNFEGDNFGYTIRYKNNCIHSNSGPIKK